MGGVPEIAVGRACDDNDDIVVRLIGLLGGTIIMTADMTPDMARGLAGLLNTVADEAEATNRLCAAFVADAREREQLQ